MRCGHVSGRVHFDEAAAEEDADDEDTRDACKAARNDPPAIYSITNAGADEEFEEEDDEDAEAASGSMIP